MSYHKPFLCLIHFGGYCWSVAFSRWFIWLAWRKPSNKLMWGWSIRFPERAIGAADATACLGMLSVTLGCVLVPMICFRQWQWRAYFQTGFLWALLAALATTGYSVLDDTALKLVMEPYSLLLFSPLIAIY